MLIKKYTSNWIEKFTLIRGELEKGLVGLDYHIEHVGSTAVPGLDGKYIIDIDIIFQTNTEFEHIKSALQKIGYHHHGNQGIEDRAVFKRAGQDTNDVLDGIKHHLYVCPRHSEALKQHILFRDYLKAHGHIRAQYQAMKYQLAAQANDDQKVYAVLKEEYLSKFINSIIEEQQRELDV